MLKQKARDLFVPGWLAWVLFSATKRLVQFFPPPDATLNSDAHWTYLPNARALLDRPWTFLTSDPASYYVAPLGYIWPALWGADPARIQLANCALFLCSVLLMWRAATRLGGVVAGVIATALLIYHPNLAIYIPQVLTESIYLFGLMLLTTASVEFALRETRARLWLGLAALGLAITLLSRPVLQIFTLTALVVGLGILGYRAWRHPQASTTATFLANRRICAALLAALALPAIVVVKNGLCFDFWGMGTGAGSGLYYGVSPFKMGLEPVYSGFSYDAGITPLTVEPETKGHPLTLAADRINARVAMGIVKGTSLPDNAVFFAHKLKAWLLYSTPELHLSKKLRSFRTFEWLAVGLTALFLVVLALHRSKKEGTPLSCLCGIERQKLVVLGVLLLGALGMALQLTPVLYNTRYNVFFLEPWLILLASVSTAVLLRHPAAVASPNRLPPSRRLLWLSGKSVTVFVLVGIPPALTWYSVRHETFNMDPYRPGPTVVLLDRTVMGSMQAAHATPLGENRWRLETESAILKLPLQITAPEALSQHQVMDAIWRLRFSVTPPADKKTPDTCRKAMLAFSNAHTPQSSYEPEPALFMQMDGAMHTYAINGNGRLRPSGTGDMFITFHCPPGTVVTWAGAELLKAALPEAARALIQQNRPIDPYLRRDPR